MKKFSIVFLIVSLLCCITLLASCKKDPCANGHTIVTDAAVPATCTDKGLTEGSHCSVCDTVITKQTEIAATGHNYGTWEVITEATCTAKGKSSKVCQNCQDEKFLDLDMTAHTSGAWIIDENADCINAGSKHKECTKCGSTTETETISALGHTEGEWITDTAAKCTVDGAKHQVCSACTATIANATIPATGHTAGDWITDTEAKCTTAGNKHQVCSVCTATIAVGTIPAIGHTAGNWITDTEAKCTTAGSKHQVCSVCTATIATDTIPTIGHTPQSAVKENEVAATCTATGSYDEVIYCAVCTDEVSRISQSIPKADHKYNTTTVQPSCATPGYGISTCAVCKYSYLSSTSHGSWKHYFDQYGVCMYCDLNCFSTLCNFLRDNGTQSSNSDGTYYYFVSTDTTTSAIYTLHYQMQYYPSSQKLEIKLTSIKGSTPVSFFSMEMRNAMGYYSYTYYDAELQYYMMGTVRANNITPSTTTIGYSETNLSSSSGKTAFNELATLDMHVLLEKLIVFLKLIPENICLDDFGFYNYGDKPHYYNTTQSYAKPTCNSGGYFALRCLHCSFTTTVAVPALGHDFSLETITKETSCKEAGSKVLECTRCNHSKTEEIPVLPHETTFAVTDPTCIEQGYTTYVCGKCGHVEINDYVNALDHDLATHYTHKPASCTTTGTERYECSRCNYYEDKEIPLLDHNYETVSGTAGYVTEKCSGCGKDINTPIPYTIAYDLAGGTATNPVEYNIETATFTLTNPTREGYTFLGWTGTGLNSTTMQVSIAIGSTGNRSYTAIWQANTYTVTYNANGGTASKPSDTAIYDQVLTLVTAERTGYSFVGWYHNNTPYTNGLWKGTENITLVAKWSPITYKINYNYAGGAASNPLEYNIETDTFTLANPTREGYTFLGWTGTGLTTTTMQVTITVGSTENRSYTANWKANTYTVTYDANKGATSAYSDTATYDKNLTLATAERTGYSFVGWYYNDIPFTDGIWKTAENVTLVAKWSPITYKINYDYAGGSATNQTMYNIESATIILTPPSKTGYTFIGWSGTDLIGLTLNVSIQSGSVGNRSYTANWKPNNYTITYDANGGMATVGSTVVTYDDDYELTTAERVGYDFAGWYADDTKWENGTWALTKNVTLVAKWAPRSDTKYVVNHHLQNVYDDGYTHYSTENLTGTSDTNITPAVGSFTGFTSPAKQTVTVAANGSLVVDYYYPRNSYTITLISNGGTGTTVTQKYDSSLSPNTWTAREGFTFGGWFTDIKLTTTFALTKMPAQNIKIYAWWTEENKPSDFTYSGTSAITINGYNGTGATLWIPMYIGNAPVTTIAAEAFVDQTTITTVIVPDNVTDIGEGAFKGCNSIENITLPFVGANANVADDKTYNRDLETSVFGYIFGMTSVSDNQQRTPVKEFGYVNTCYTWIPTGTIWQFSNSSDFSHSYVGTSYYYKTSYFYYIPTTIKSVTITQQTTIPDAAFNNCNFIKNISLPTTTTTIGNYTFQNCAALTFVRLPNIISIGDYAFSDCTALKGINSNTENTVLLPNTLVSIGKCAFQNATSIMAVIIPNSVTSIGEGAFKGCTSLENITLPFIGETESSSDTDTAVFGHIFGKYKEDWKYPTSGPEGLTYQGWRNGTFATSGTGGYNNSYQSGCRADFYYIPASLKKITITLDTTIPYGAFQNCKFVESIVFDQPIASIGVQAFCGCTSLSKFNSDTDGELIVPESITKINAYSFKGLSQITTVFVPESIVYIAGGAFKECNSIKEITLPFVGEDCSSDGMYGVFGHIFGSSNEYLSDTVQQFDSRYYFIPQTIREVIITGGTQINTHAFYNCDFIESITLPVTVTNISQNAFLNCSSLTSITFGGTIIEWSTITKDSTWDIGTGNYVVYCSDGQKEKA